jgi:hypothetical protein
VADVSHLVGTWKLIAYEHWTNGQVTYPMGRDACGYLSYDPQGCMSVQIMRADRPALRAGHLAEGTLEELRTIMAGYLGYAGTYEVNDRAGTVTHYVDVHLLPNAVGACLTRRFEVCGDRLTLYTAADGRQEGGRLIWERVGQP